MLSDRAPQSSQHREGWWRAEEQVRLQAAGLAQAAQSRPLAQPRVHLQLPQPPFAGGTRLRHSCPSGLSIARQQKQALFKCSPASVPAGELGSLSRRDEGILGTGYKYWVLAVTSQPWEVLGMCAIKSGEMEGTAKTWGVR